MDDYCKDLFDFSITIKNHAKSCDDDSLANQYWRTAISKSYYSVYHKSKQVADRLPQAQVNGSHEKVIQTLASVPLASANNNPDYKRKLKRISLYLAQLKSNRVDADYMQGTSYNESEVNLHFSTVSKVNDLHNEIAMMFSSKAV